MEHIMAGSTTRNPSFTRTLAENPNSMTIAEILKSTVDAEKYEKIMIDAWERLIILRHKKHYPVVSTVTGEPLPCIDIVNKNPKQGEVSPIRMLNLWIKTADQNIAFKAERAIHIVSKILYGAIKTPEDETTGTLDSAETGINDNRINQTLRWHLNQNNETVVPSPSYYQSLMSTRPDFYKLIAQILKEDLGRADLAEKLTLNPQNKKASLGQTLKENPGLLDELLKHTEKFEQQWEQIRTAANNAYMAPFAPQTSEAPKTQSFKNTEAPETRLLNDGDGPFMGFSAAPFPHKMNVNFTWKDKPHESGAPKQEDLSKDNVTPLTEAIDAIYKQWLALMPVFGITAVTKHPTHVELDVDHGEGQPQGKILHDLQKMTVKRNANNKYEAEARIVAHQILNDSSYISPADNNQRVCIITRGSAEFLRALQDELGNKAIIKIRNTPDEHPVVYQHPQPKKPGTNLVPSQLPAVPVLKAA
jgi:hypothetical protein